ncbi:hypothetical protein GCM10025864_24310 [Luteimicrobium album]|uniref:Protein kinase domain-containing protein n=1 Tax=Luteimicrobium album TaxID=1054550 RepID=A0ABQ6I231_9MICO|nr:serine/threonine-protein kinase [Luteimicrobium album]GMA24672.1 hypothetical protein GCM10025864_24310 [Luteimicrobium album]
MWAAATPGDEVGGYRIVARLGQGATGAVYRAEDGGGHPVAIKVLHAGPDTDESARARLAREAATLRRLDHPAVAAVLDVELEGESPFIVTELVDGHSLEDDVALHGPYDAARLASLAGDLADALQAVHGAGVVHRDLKPSNIMVTAHGPVLIDFGIAHGFEDARMTTDGLVMGTPGYLAPEMLTGADPSVATDWWGWAASLAFAATARAPFGVTPVDAVLARAQAGAADLRGVGPLRGEAIAGALRPDPGERWQPDDVVRALRKAADGGDEPHPVAPGDLVETVALGAASQWPTQVVTRDPRTAPVNDGRTRAVATDVPPPPPPATDATEVMAPVEPAAGADGQDTDWLEPVPEEVYESASGYVRPRHPSRSGLLVALALPLVAAAATWPGLAFVALAALVVLARYVGYAADSSTAAANAAASAGPTAHASPSSPPGTSCAASSGRCPRSSSPGAPGSCSSSAPGGCSTGTSSSPTPTTPTRTPPGSTGSSSPSPWSSPSCSPGSVPRRPSPATAPAPGFGTSSPGGGPRSSSWSSPSRPRCGWGGSRGTGTRSGGGRSRGRRTSPEVLRAGCGSGGGVEWGARDLPSAALVPRAAPASPATVARTPLDPTLRRPVTCPRHPQSPRRASPGVGSGDCPRG